MTLLAACAPQTPPATAQASAQARTAATPAPQPPATTSIRWMAPRPNGAAFDLGGWQHVLAAPPPPLQPAPSIPASPNGPPPPGSTAGERARIALAALHLHCTAGPHATTPEDRALIAWLMAPIGPPGTPPDCALLRAADELRAATGRV